MIYYTYFGENTQFHGHYFQYGTINIVEEGLSLNDTYYDPPRLKPEIIEDIEAWGGTWNPNGIEVRFPDLIGAMKYKLKYGTENHARDYEIEEKDENGVLILREEGLY